MDCLPLPIVATFALALSASTPARAFGTHHAFCLTGDEWRPGAEQLHVRQLRAVSGEFVRPRADLHRESIFRRPERRSLRLPESSARARRPAIRPAIGRAEMRGARLALVAIGVAVASVPARAQTYDPSCPVSHADLRPSRLFRLPLRLAGAMQISRRRPLRDLCREPVFSRRRGRLRRARQGAPIRTQSA